MGQMESSILKAVGFVHLHVHSAFSLREGALAIETLAKLAAADEMPALAITDTNNLFGALEFSEKLAKAGVQPIIGAQAMVDFGDAPLASSRLAEQRAARAPIVLLAQSEIRLPPFDAARLEPVARSEGRRRAAYPLRRARRLRRPYRTDRRAGRADRQGARPEHGGPRRKPGSGAWPQAFDKKLYVELQRHGLEVRDNDRAGADRALPTEIGLPLVATNEAYFAAASDYEAHDALLCIAEGALLSTAERRRLSPEHRFKTRAEMTALFADLPEATRSQRRDRHALRLPAADAKAHPAALLHPRRRGGG